MSIIKHITLTHSEDSDYCQCPFCGEEYLCHWTHYPGSYWTPPDWEEHVEWEACEHMVDIDEGTATYCRWPRLYELAYRLKARWTGRKAWLHRAIVGALGWRKKW